MARQLEVSWGYSEKPHYVGDVDFYRSLPGMTEHLRTSDGQIPRGSADPNQIIYWFGSAVLSSSVLASAIKAYLVHRRRKIVLTIRGTEKKLEYEGPSLEGDQEAIEEMIDRLASETDTAQEGTVSLRIYAERPNG